jgi:glutamate formiminotransferase/formiminotetrahydrofolate cyclodeaminase
MGAMGAALGTMVANLSAHKKGWDDRWEEFSDWAEKGKSVLDQLLKLVDEDTNAFNAILDAFKLPQKSEGEKQVRKEAIQQATRFAMEVPLKVMQLSCQSMEVIKAMVEIGNPNSVTDAGVGALAIRSAVLGAAMNIKINSKGLTDKEYVATILKEVQELEQKTIQQEKEILDLVNRMIEGK